MSPEVYRLFEAASNLPLDQRSDYLQTETADAEVRREVLSLLAHDALAGPFFADALGSAAASIRMDLDLRPGTRIGAFHIVQMLGRGGMGAVYLAVRADGLFDQKVAIKVIQSSTPGSFLSERFRQERQILARLNHPNIARLLDGGETPAGLPYFVMEYVAGREIDRHCDNGALDLRARLRLLLQVCAAVQYAHENLVVHRDLKPGNILVGEDGTLKLLDFGIAKVLDPLLGATAAVSTRVLTPEYASPEQVRGDPITTSADIYSLGAVLYRVLTGNPPHALQDLSPLDAARRVSQQQAPRASNVPADVGAIMEKALHTDPARRYRSADELSNDIQRYLDGEPVLAASDSVGYRTAKFLRRNWIPVCAIAAVALALTVGAGVAVWQARRAERHFAEVRQLSNKFLFEFEEAIHNVAGATKARELLVRTSQQYLDRLAADAGDDRDLVHELAEAYRKLGDVEGSIAGGNKGDTKAALASYGRAVALRDSIGDERAPDIKNKVNYVIALSDLASLEDQAGDASRALQLSTKAVHLSEKWVNATAGDIDLLTAAATANTRLASIQTHKGKFEQAVSSSRRSVEIRRRVLDLNPANGNSLQAVASGYCDLGMAEQAAGNLREAVTNHQNAIDLLRQLTARSPENVSNRRKLMLCSWQFGSATKMLLKEQNKDLAPVLSIFERALIMGRELIREDPADALVASDVAGLSVTFGATLQQLGHPREAIAVLQPAIESETKRLSNSPGDRALAFNLTLLLMWAGNCHLDMHDVKLALAERRTAAGLFGHLVAANPTNYAYAHQQADNLREIGDVLVGIGDYPAARESYQRGLKIAEKLPLGKASLDAPNLIAALLSSLENLPRGGGGSRDAEKQFPAR